MIRATTPIHTFLFENDPSQYSQILIIYAQGDNVIMEKGKDDLTIEPIYHGETEVTVSYRAYYQLTQEETKKFKAGIGKPVYVQVRVLTPYGDAMASDKKLIQLKDVLDDRVLA